MKKHFIDTLTNSINVYFYILRAFKKFSSHICISNDSENRIFPICPLYSLGDQLPIYILVYFKRTIIVVPTLDFLCIGLG